MNGELVKKWLGKLSKPNAAMDRAERKVSALIEEQMTGTAKVGPGRLQTKKWTSGAGGAQSCRSAHRLRAETMPMLKGRASDLYLGACRPAPTGSRPKTPSAQ